MLIAWPMARATFDLETLGGLSDNPDIPLVVSERTLHILQNLAGADVADPSRYVDIAYELRYQPPVEGEEPYGVFLSVADRVSLELSEVTPMWEPGDLRFMAADASLGEGPPYAWLYCDGSQVPIDDYPDLYDRIGDTWGSASSGNFRLPDFRGRSPQGHDSTDDPGDLVGQQYQTSVPSHAHEMGSATAETGAGPYVQRTTTFGANISTNAFGVGSPGVDQRGPRATVVVWIKT